MTAATVRVEISKPTGSGRRTGWWKQVTSVDRSKKGGWTLLGTFLDEGERDLPVGAVVVCCSPQGSTKHPWKSVSVHTVSPNGLEPVMGEGCDADGDYDLHKQTPSLLDCVELALVLRPIEDSANPLSAFTTDELKAEVARREAAA